MFAVKKNGVRSAKLALPEVVLSHSSMFLDAGLFFGSARHDPLIDGTWVRILAGRPRKVVCSDITSDRS
jgi:hypothetical protein